MSTIRKRISSNSTSRSEQTLFDTAICLNDAWDVWMNVQLNFAVKKSGTSIDHEVDCILYHRKYGMLLIECKDGHISTEEAQGTEKGVIWKQGNRIMERSPIEQIKASTHPLHDYFSEMFPKAGHQYNRIRVQWAVCFPDMDSTGRIGNNALQPRHAILKSDLKSYNTLERKVRKILETGELSYGGKPFPNDELSDEDYDRLTSFLGCFDEPSWPELWEMESRARVAPTAFQEMLMESITRNPRMQIEGVAGSGKSLLVQWETRRLAREGKRVAVLCYNDLLAEQMRQNFKSLGLDESQAVATSFHKLAAKYARIAKVAGVPRREPEDDAAKSEYYDAVVASLPGALKTLRDKKKNLFFDALVIDEGQDFENRWLDSVLQLLKDPQKGTVRFFYDPNQTIYKDRDVLGNRTIGAMPVMVLKRGFRCTKRILEWVHDTTDIRIPCYENTPEGRPVDVRTYTEPKEQEELLLKEIERLHKKGVTFEDILVVSLRSRRNSGLASLNNDTFRWSDISDSLNGAVINIVSAYRYKGLDKRVVILTDLEPSKNGPGYPHSNAHLILVGATRAKEHLVVFRQRHRI